jgi:1,4-alpha-glucan branching enzyme
VVHGKRSLLGKMPGDLWRMFANLRLLYAYQYAQPGKKMLFMGGELAQMREWNHDTELDWHLLDRESHRGVHRLVADLNRIYRASPALWEIDFDHRGFEWIDFTDVDHSVVSFLRRGKEAGDYLVCVFNLTPVPHEGYRVGVPEQTWYREVLNTDSAHYGGSDMGNEGGRMAEPVPAHGRPCSVALRLPPLAGIWLAPEPRDPVHISRASG